ncbi:hypothetical protein Gotri_000299 [Gossypium trilobum]|uniref:Uncharacterized protein n=1 Tax=Gossypium trilobum TaxID=34281 RepID=A0A7J9FAV0_9ROSI|nr:hypothetical protein [Gossypium trilobum]
MSKLKSKEKVDDGDRSWLELLNGVETSTSSENEKLHKLTQMLLSKFVARLVTKMENKMKKQKTRGNRKKKQKINDQRKRQDPEKVMEMGLEPPPDMPQVFKDCIQDFGGSEIKLVIQKFLQVFKLVI